MPIKYTVDSDEIDSMTLDKLQDFIDDCKTVGMTGKDKIRLIGRNEGFHFNGTFSFTPQRVRAEVIDSPTVIINEGEVASAKPGRYRARSGILYEFDGSAWRYHYGYKWEECVGIGKTPTPIAFPLTATI